MGPITLNCESIPGGCRPVTRPWYLSEQVPALLRARPGCVPHTAAGWRHSAPFCFSQPLCAGTQMQVNRSQKKYLVKCLLNRFKITAHCGKQMQALNKCKTCRCQRRLLHRHSLGAWCCRGEMGAILDALRSGASP